jgi:nicotinic acid mononucleotide adenylyltransferase
MVDVDRTDITRRIPSSSSEVRVKVRAKDSSSRQMVPNGIAKYIEEHKLYLL